MGRPVPLDRLKSSGPDLQPVKVNPTIAIEKRAIINLFFMLVLIYFFLFDLFLINFK